MCRGGYESVWGYDVAGAAGVVSSFVGTDLAGTVAVVSSSVDAVRMSSLICLQVASSQ